MILIYLILFAKIRSSGMVDRVIEYLKLNHRGLVDDCIGRKEASIFLPDAITTDN